MAWELVSQTQNPAQLRSQIYQERLGPAQHRMLVYRKVVDNGTWNLQDSVKLVSETAERGTRGFGWIWGSGFRGFEKFGEFRGLGWRGLRV